MVFMTTVVSCYQNEYKYITAADSLEELSFNLQNHKVTFSGSFTSF